ncbi:hypothetical protein N7G274_004740 [Stereocaulon virgatum]|uniref:Cytochrome P450 monooxygenase n=1 Tax=Stereocaulon virgatum TaxID=373712 RepID=A0ABR4A8N1_9LECA
MSNSRMQPLFYRSDISLLWLLKTIPISLLIFSLPLVFLIVRGIYNRYFHPLRGFPGPFWSSVTDLYKVYVLSSTDVSSLTLKLHEKYGPLVRVAPNMLSFSKAHMIAQVYHRKVDKDDFWTHGALGEHPPMLQTKDHEEHVKKRKIIAPVLSWKSLLRFESWVDEETLRLRNKIKQRYVEPKRDINLADWIKWYLYDTTTHIMFQRRLGFVDQGRDVNGLLAAFRYTALLVGLMALFPYLLGPLVKLPVIKNLVLPRSSDTQGVGKVMKEQDKLMESAKPGKSLLNSLLGSQAVHKYAISDEDLKTETLMLLVAAPDTTSTLICSIIDNVIKRPVIYDRLLSEITAFSTKGELSTPVATFAEIKRMPYFTACIYETARLYPSLPVLLPRRVSPGGLLLDGRYVPEGATIGASPSVVNKDPDVFGADAAEYRPERWLGPPEQVAQMSRFLFTWGFGTRKCAGKNLALLETYKLCLMMFRDFSIEPARPLSSKPRREDKGFAIYDDLALSLTKRDTSILDEECEPDSPVRR